MPTGPTGGATRVHRSTKPCTACKTLIHHKANAPYQGLSYSPKPPGYVRWGSRHGLPAMFAARLLLGEFVTGYEASGGVGAPKGTPVEVIDELNKEIQGIIDRNCLGTS